MQRKSKHWTCEEIGDLLARNDRVTIGLESHDTAPNYTSASTRVCGAGNVTYQRNGAGGITITIEDGARVI